MVLLLIFSFISGLITIFAPCIWPILPIILSATATGGKRKPLGLSLGIVISFGLLTLTLSYIVRIIPFDPNSIRYVAVVVIGLLGIALVVPKFSQILESFVSSISGRIGLMKKGQSDGFWSGFLTGITLGIVWTPCAGPILATIATLAATQSVNANVALITLFYVTGVGIPLFVFATLGKKLFTKTRFLSQYTGRIQQLFGVIMILTAVSIATNYDKILQLKLLNAFPSYSQFLTNLESNPNVIKEINTIKGNKVNDISQTTGKLFNVNNVAAPEFIGITKWLNTDHPISIKELKGKIILVDFWTYTCINCIRTLPHVLSWYDKYKSQGFIVIGVHTPEFEFEKDTGNVQNAIKQYIIHFPVAQDNTYATWNNYNNQYWPAEYLIDASGNIRRTHFGEGEYSEMEIAIQTLLKEAGQKVTNSLDTMPDQTPKTQLSPETYIGSSRMQYYFPNGSLPNGMTTLSLNPTIPQDTFSLGGQWTIGNEFSSSGKNAVLTYNFSANKVYLVLRPPNSDEKTTVKVMLDWKPVDSKSAGDDVLDGTITVDRDRLYNLIDLKGNIGRHILELNFGTIGTEVFAFTFG